MEKHRTTVEHAPKFKQWFAERGGIAVWPSVNLSNPGASWTTPATHEDGTPATKPTWQAGNTPRLITDPAEVIVDTPKEVRRMHVGLRRGSQGLSVKLTDASSAKVRRAVAEAGDEAWYEFDYARQDVVIFVPGESVTLDKA